MPLAPLYNVDRQVGMCCGHGKGDGGKVGRHSILTCQESLDHTLITHKSQPRCQQNSKRESQASQISETLFMCPKQWAHKLMMPILYLLGYHLEEELGKEEI